MLGAIVGDIVGSVHEGRVLGTKDFTLFAERATPTDDSVLSIATADVLLNGGDYADTYRRYARRYPAAGFGSGFYDWAFSEGAVARPSYGNGGAMRVSPVGWAYNSLEAVLDEAARSAEPTHDHPEGAAGAKAIASAVFLARTGSSKQQIRDYASAQFGYDVSATATSIGASTVRASESVPHAFVAFLDSSDFEDAVRNAVFIGGDTDTIASMAGAIAEAFYGGVPKPILDVAMCYLDDEMRQTVECFRAKFMAPGAPSCA